MESQPLTLKLRLTVVVIILGVFYKKSLSMHKFIRGEKHSCINATNNKNDKLGLYTK